MSILSTNNRLISIGESYSAGNGIDITDQVISVTGDATPYSAGENIYIQDHIISGKDWSNDITEASSHAYNETTAWVKENYTNSADMTYISAVVDTKLDASAWSSVSGDFATEPYVIMSDNITYDRAKGYVDSQQFAKESACQSAFDYLNTNKLDDISFIAWQNGQYSTDLQTIEGQISNKLDESAFSQVSGSFLTAINIPESAVWQDVSTTVQSNSAQWAEGGGLTGDYVSGVNFVKEPYEEGIVRGTFYSANVSGDVSVTVGEYDGTSYYNTTTYSLSSLGPQVNDKLNAYLITDSKTLRKYENRYEVFEKSYRPTGTATASADIVTLDNGNCYITFEKNSKIKNATIILESNTEGFVNTEEWDKVSYENNSATLTKSYGYDAHYDLITFNSSDGWNVTNCDATCTTYSGFEVAELAFKDEIPSGETISSYTTAWCHDVPPYGDGVIERLNDKYLKAFISNSADRAKFANNANNANSANYAETVNETYVENKGFTRNLSSEYGTISVIHNNIIESTNSAIVRTGNEGFVSSFDGASIGPEGNGIATYSWEKSLPNTIISLQFGWTNSQILTYSANTNFTGEIVLPKGENTQTINIPNATEFKVWTNNWVNLNSVTVSAADQFETVVGELAWASALPTYEYDNTNKISAINGSALAGGSDIPSGTMNVSGLEYNAVNEISAYNGSAIAQYGAEKQWLVHDDTLVHAANSAQYALGCNISALQRLMGIDETVLFTSSWNDKLWNVNLSEPISSFKKIRMYVTRNEGASELKTYEYETDLLTSFITLEIDSTLSNNIYKYFTLCNLSGATYTELSARIFSYPNSLNDWRNTNSWCHPIKIIGIGRKA